METFSALLSLCAGNSQVTGEFPSQRPVTRNFDVFFDMRLNKRLSKQSWGWWFETLSHPLWRFSNETCPISLKKIKSMGEVQDFNNSSALAMELLWYCTKPSKYEVLLWFEGVVLQWFMQYNYT